MKLYQRLVVGSLSLISACLLVAGCEARQVPAGKPVFDYYLLSLSLAPAFCEEALGRRRVPRQCRDLTQVDFQRQPLTLHGLWPNRRSGKHPFYCNGERDRGEMCDQTPVTLPAGLSRRLQRVMPGVADCLDRHEWAKHGSCSGLAMEEYFDASVRLVDRANRAMAEVLASHAGRELGLDTLRMELKKRDPALVKSVVFDCRMPRTDRPERRKPMLREVRIYLEKRADGRIGEPMDFREAGVRHFNSGCSAGRAYVDMP